MLFLQTKYAELNARQKENYNFFKLAAVLAEYGYFSHRMTDDYGGADLLAVHTDGNGVLKIQLKSRFGFHKKYLRKNIWIAYRRENNWYIYDHDKLLSDLSASLGFANSKSWTEKSSYTWPQTPMTVLENEHHIQI